MGGRERMPQKIANAREKLMQRGKIFLLQNADGKQGKLSIRNLTAECGIALGTFYHYFSSKDDLVRQILWEDWQHVLGAIDESLRCGGTLYEKVHCLYDQLDGFEQTYRCSALALFSPTRENIDFREENLRLLYERVQVFLREEVEHGELKLYAETTSAAYLLVQLFLATSRNRDMDFDELWKCMNFQDGTAEQAAAEGGKP